ncbi:MAG: hypothetical protein A3B11_02335 [Candidatus Taylorbacteria bacterium RIFCSPLOWO2_01_FULL_44_26]|uniref:phenylalanine--tRNA ligase n=2 Tax=Candidatus Tayloriibacteriota TaxID=1817919 RepID=A0A1G2MK91_9BACT|nr:MAG: hypothetical protein A3D50_01375 [Candidatus Taylorbacteria bacterium RIFCSPHIGHO2_02_FULL_44_12]OHA30800.1 MAG: hypothetical protein A3B11_02335 [Candidatus Taylorbacteria bacterium RIFCSPLOWO2_01_FULL_44_26]
MNIIANLEDQKKLLAELETRTDTEAKRMKRYIAMPDLSRTSDSPINEIVNRALAVKSLSGFDTIEVPEIVPAQVTFDLFNMPPGHPARSKSDTYYVNNDNILRTHDTVMWHYYLTLPEIKEKMDKGESFGVICYGKVYRKDEIDNKHMNVFHQFGGLYLTPDTKETITLDDLKKVLTEIAQSIFGQDVKNRFNPDTFPYTDPSMEMEIEKDGQWIEILGCGLPRKSVLTNFAVSGYNGWAFGFGLERLAIVSMDIPDIRLLWSDDPRVKKQLILGRKFVPVSKYPTATRDISFVVDDSFRPNDYFDLIRDIGGDLVEEVKLSDKYQDESKFGKGKTSYTYRIIYGANDRTLTSLEIDAIQAKIYAETASQFGAKLR